MNNLEQAFLSGFVKRAEAHGIATAKAVELFKEAATPAAMVQMINRAPNLTQGLRGFDPRAIFSAAQQTGEIRNQMAQALKGARAGVPTLSRAEFSNLAHGLEGQVAPGTTLGNVVGSLRSGLNRGDAAQAANIRAAIAGRHGPGGWMDRFDTAQAPRVGAY